MAKKHVFQPASTPCSVGNGYPKPFDDVAPDRVKHVLGDHAGLNQFGVNYVVIPPGNASAHRHWHRNEDEFVYLLQGEAVLITDDGEEAMTVGDCVGFPAGVANGHHIVNRSAGDVHLLEVGTRAKDEEAFYPDVDLHVTVNDRNFCFTNKKGKPF
ncbi:MAG: cupin domain-containing protein [Pseudomonadota bacterium]